MWKVLLGFLIRLFSLLASCVLMIAGLLELPAADAERSTNPTAPQQMMVCFLDVGQADAALVVADGEAMLIDGGNVGDSDKIVAALRKNRVSHLSVVVCTHGHEDHVGGLAAALKECTADTVYSPITRYDSKAFSDFVAYANRRGCELTVPKQGGQFLPRRCNGNLLIARTLCCNGKRYFSCAAHRIWHALVFVYGRCRA